MWELEAEAAWIAVDRPQAARKLVEKMLEASARLGEYPYSGKHVRDILNFRSVNWSWRRTA
jgi:plasmid stabilization system protein ParE